MKDIRYSRLFDIYSSLLTDNQREIFELYYAFDLSLSEIAEQKGVTRQSVADALKKTRAELNALENKLFLLEKFTAIGAVAEKLGGAAGLELNEILKK